MQTPPTCMYDTFAIREKTLTRGRHLHKPKYDLTPCITLVQHWHEREPGAYKCLHGDFEDWRKITYVMSNLASKCAKGPACRIVTRERHAFTT